MKKYYIIVIVLSFFKNGISKNDNLVSYAILGKIMIKENYSPFVDINDENEIVYIVRIMYRGRDVRKQLSRTEEISEN